MLGVWGRGKGAMAKAEGEGGLSPELSHSS